MKRANLIWFIVIAVFLTIPRIASAQDRRDDSREEWRERLDEWMRGDRRDVRDRDVRDRDIRDLEGRWYANGERDKPTEIVSSRRGLQAKDERGRTTRLEIDRDGDIRALDWDRGLRGDVRRGTIEWANGTTWTRKPSERVARRR